VLVAGYVLTERRRTRTASGWGNPALLPNVLSGLPRWRRHVPPALLLLALAALVVGLARPAAAFSVRKEQANVVLVIDVSFSMAAKDVRPTRLQAAQVAALTFIDRVPEKYRIGVVTFADKAQVVTPATADRELVRTAIRSLRLGQGTALGEGIVRGIQVTQAVPRTNEQQRTGERIPSAMLLISDGAQTQGQVQPLQAAQAARAREIPVYAVALGTADGVVERPLPGGFKERITVPPDPQTLRQIAALTNGQFFTAPDQEQLQAVYERLGSRLGSRTERKEVTAAFAAGGALLLLVAGGLSALWFHRLP
jgi:Ca-activated chloride channel family protein